MCSHNNAFITTQREILSWCPDCNTEPTFHQCSACLKHFIQGSSLCEINGKPICTACDLDMEEGSGALTEDREEYEEPNYETQHLSGLDEISEVGSGGALR